MNSLSNISSRYLLLRIDDISEDIKEGYRGGHASTNHTETKGNQIKFILLSCGNHE